MSNYAANAKLSDLRLADDPALPAKPTADEAGPSASAEGALRDVDAKNRPANDTLGELRLADEPARSVGVPPRDDGSSASVGNADRIAVAGGTDKYLAAAIREFEAGEIDQPLWVRAVSQTGADEDLAKAAYLRARATALRVTKRDKRAEAKDRRARTESSAERTTITQTGDTRRPQDTEVADDREERTWSKRALLIGGALGLVLVLTVYMLTRSPGDLTGPAATAQSGKPVQTAPADSAKVAATKARALDRTNVSSDDYIRKVQELKDAGSWNVLVLHAAEWTRKFPGNADAWNELSMGYVKLHQFNEALEAATKAVQLAPENAQAWQNLGEINVALQLPAAALTAYDRAAELNPRDVTSLVQIGMLNAQLGRLPQAGMAFIKALDVSPLDADALCGAASIAQREARSKDAEVYLRQLKAANLQCRVSSTVEAVSVAPPPAAKKKPASAATR